MRPEIFLMIAGMAAVTFITRFAFIVLFRKAPFSERLSRWLRFIPIAILSTLIAPTILVPQGSLDLSLHNSYLLAGITSVGVALKTRNIIATVGAGMAVILLLRAVLGWS
jgi:branched-subunit amino acid transport protein